MASLSLSFWKRLEPEAQNASLLRTLEMYSAWKTFNQNTATGGVSNSVGALLNSRVLQLRTIPQFLAP